MSETASKVFSAEPRDAERIEALLSKAGIIVSRSSLSARLEDDDQGVLLCGEATISWTLDGGALHLYDLATPNDEAIRDLVTMALRLARSRFAAAIVFACFEDSRALPALQTLEFVIDSREREIRGNEVLDLLTLVRET